MSAIVRPEPQAQGTEPGGSVPDSKVVDAGDRTGHDLVIDLTTATEDDTAVVRRSALRRHLVPALCLLTALALWTTGLVGGVSWRDMTDVGLVSVLPVVCLLGLAVLVVGFVASLAPAVAPRWWQAHVAVLILLLHGTPTLLYGTLRYAWAWKHLGIVDYISRNGAVDTTAADLAVYHGWPGFFTLNAMLAESTGVTDLSGVASWWPVLVNLAIVPAVALIARGLSEDRRVVAVTCWVYVLTAWVGQDYFAPQALAFLLYLVLVGIGLRLLGMRRPTVPAATRDLLAQGRHGGVRRLTGRLGTVVVTGWHRLGRQLSRLWRGWHLHRPVVPGVAMLLVVAIASSHQLTPAMVVITFSVLLATGYAGTVWLPIGGVVAAVGWALLFAWPVLVDNSSEVAAVGRVGSNVAGTLTDLDVVSPGHALVSLVSRGLTVAVAGLAVAGFLRAWSRGRWHGAALALVVSPVLLIALSAYGDEILFRIYLFGLPASAFLAATLLVSDRGDRMAALLVTAVSALLVPAFLLAYLGNERVYAFSPEEVQLATALYDSAPPGSLLVEGTRNYPTQSRRYDTFRYVPIDREEPATRQRIVADPVGELARWLDNPQHTGSYLLLTRSMRNDADVLGTMPAGGLAHIEAELAASPRFTEVARNRDGVVFVLTADVAVTPPIVLPPVEGRG